MASNIKTIYGTLVADNAIVGPLGASNSIVSVAITGTFVGTLQLQAQSNLAPNGFSPIIPDGMTTPNITAAGLYAFPRIAGDFSFRIQMTAYTSGTAYAVLSLCPSF